MGSGLPDRVENEDVRGFLTFWNIISWYREDRHKINDQSERRMSESLTKKLYRSLVSGQNE